GNKNILADSNTLTDSDSSAETDVISKNILITTIELTEEIIGKRLKLLTIKNLTSI
ncbi:16224_t:CDS:1, partial [Dentiscutata erythropus]